MFLLYLLSLLTNLAAAPVYSRTYLRGLQRIERNRQQADWISRGTMYIENAVLATARKGLTQYTTEPVICEAVGELANLDKESCETIVHGILAAASDMFLDSDLTYDNTTKRYTLSWTDVTPQT